MKKFLRRNSDRHSKLGRKRKKKQIWRKPKGRHNKMREKIRGYPAVVKIGYRSNNKESGKFDGKEPILIRNVKDLEKMKGNEIGIIAKIGKRKKIELAQKAKEKGIKLYNLNVKKYLNKNKLKTGEKVKSEESK